MIKDNKKRPYNKKPIQTTGLEGVKNALKLLKKHLPLFQKSLPLELNCFNKVYEEISKQEQSKLYSKKIFRRAIARHTGSVEYLENCLIEGYRYNLALESVSELSNKEIEYFEEKLKETKIRVAEFHKEFMAKKAAKKPSFKPKEKTAVTKKVIKKKRTASKPETEDTPKKFSFK